MIYLLLLLPVLTCLILYIVLRNTIAFKVGGLFVLITLCYSLAHESSMKTSLTTDTEWWGNYATSIHDYDDWDDSDIGQAGS